MLMKSASRLPPCARVIHSAPSVLNKSLSASSSSIQQCRSIRTSVGASIAGSNAPHNSSRQPGVSHYKKADTEAQSPTTSKTVLKKAMAASISASSASTTAKFVSVNEITALSDDMPGARTSRNTENIEQQTIDHLLRRDPSGSAASASGMANIQEIFDSQRAPREVTPEDVLHATALPVEETDSFIDPITNRRVVRSFAPRYADLDEYGPIKDADPPARPTIETLVQDAQRYRSTQFEEPQGLPRVSAEEGSKEYKDLDEYAPSTFDNPDKSRKLTPEEKTKNYQDLDDYNPVMWNEPNGLPKPAPEEQSKKYKDLDKYAAVKIDNPDAPRKLTPEEASKLYNDLHLYEAVRWNEPNGLVEPTPEEKSKQYPDLDQYGPVHWSEPDGLRPLTSEELSRNYDDVSKYGAVRWSEPDGLRKLTPEEISKQYDDLHKYAQGFVCADSLLEAHEAAQMDPTPKAEPLAARVNAPIEDKSMEYKDLSKYGPVRWNEPDGLRKLTPEELSKNYEDLHLYGGASKWHEPDGLQSLTAEEKSKDYRDLPEYAQYDNTGPKVERVHPEEASKQYKDLHEYTQYDETGPEIERIHPEEASKQYEDLDGYAQHDITGPEVERIHPEEASKQYEDLSRYPSQGYEEPAQIGRIHPEDASKPYEDLSKYSSPNFDLLDKAYPATADADTPIYDDLGKYNPQQFDSVDKDYPIHPEEATKAYPDLHLYQGFGRNKPIGKIVEFPNLVRDRVEPYQAKAPLQEYTTAKPSWVDQPFEDQVDPMDSLTVQEIREGVLRRAREKSGSSNSGRILASPGLSQTEEETDHGLMGMEQPMASEDGRNLTGYYVRDFPEEFTRSWSAKYSPSGSSIYPKDHDEGSLAPEGAASLATDADEDGCPASMDESFPGESPIRMEPALHRLPPRSRLSTQEKAKLNADPYSTIPQGLQTSYAEECDGKATWPTMVRHYSAKAAPGETKEKEGDSGKTGHGSSSGNGPTVYKILAYDSTTQFVAEAETSSSVIDLTSPSTPSDVMSRLSNPSKFLPHFRAMERQGYEIFSGSGDVLVFRKVRSSLPIAETGSAGPDAAQRKPARVNPIDMMGYSAAGNFTSPTGFVNYNSMVEESWVKPVPPYRRSSSVQEEEGRPTSEDASSSGVRDKKRGLGRRVALTAIGLTGGVYALGVMGEFFSTGGADGKRMKRL